MMNKILLLALFITPTLWAQDGSEEAIILNQELQFLEDSANDVSVAQRSQMTPQQRALPIAETSSNSLEAEYFGEGSQDTIRSRAAAPKRIRSNRSDGRP